MKQEPPEPIQFGEVFEAELDYVRRRRESVGARRNAEGGAVSRKLSDDASPSVEHGLVGLALSSGGIRSATFNLGVVQALHRHGILDHVDYLSTVSGGGYLGASISTIMRDGAEFPFEHREGPTKPAALRWLQNHANFLVKRGPIDRLRALANQLRATFLNFLLLVPVLLLTSLFLGLYYGGPLEPRFLNRGVLHRWEGIEFFPWSDTFNFTPLALVGAAIFYLAYPAIIRVFKVMTKEQSAETGSERSVKLRDFYEQLHAWVMVAVGCVLAIETLPILLHWFHEAGELGQQLAGVGAIGALVAVSGAVALVKLLGGLFKKLVIVFIGLLGLLLPLLFILFVGEWLAYEPTASSPVGWYLLVDNEERVGGIWYILVVLWSLMTAGGLASLVAKQTSKIVLVGIGGLIGAGVGILTLWFAFQPGLQPPLFVAALAFVTWLFCWSSLDINLTSMHGLYRDRLASAFIFGAVDAKIRLQRQPEIGLDSLDVEEDLRFRDICQQGSIAPYHLINVALNTSGSPDPGFRARRWDSLLFSREFYGGPATGYCSTENLQAVFPQVDLGTATAISAAALATSGSLSETTGALTLLNARHGYWAPNPRPLAEWAAGKSRSVTGSVSNWFSWRVRPWALVNEFRGNFHENHRFAYLSDGSHVEALGILELLRRRCRFIIAGDATLDPDLSFGSLATLQRLASADLGVRIELPLQDLRLGEAGLSRKHCSVGRITYPEKNQNGESHVGYLLYVKPTFTGDENPVINEVRARSTTFPHESSAEELMAVDQFEAYRALGYHQVEGLVPPSSSDELPTCQSFADFETWFEGLAAKLAPRPRGVFISYRRDDAPTAALYLAKRLEEHFGKEQVFMDVGDIDAGADFSAAIQEALGSCGVVLVLMGKSWLGQTDSSGRRRLDLPDDWVRQETLSALQEGKHVIPVLVERAVMPREPELPEELQKLAFQNAVNLTHERFDSDLDGLVKIVEVFLDRKLG